MTEPVFADGMSFFFPRAGAPDYVKGTISVQPTKFIEFLKGCGAYINDKGYIYLDVKVSKQSGKPYVSVNTWKPTDKNKEVIERVEQQNEEIASQDIPF